MRTGYNMAESHVMNCYDGCSYYRSEPAEAEEIYNSNWENSMTSFSPTCYYRFSDGSLVEVGYSGAWVIAD